VDVHIVRRTAFMQGKNILDGVVTLHQRFRSYMKYGVTLKINFEDAMLKLGGLSINRHSG
jgi:hypothetical protein